MCGSWGIRLTSWAGCYLGYDQPKPLGRGAGGGSMCGPVFNEFMQHAIEKYGGGRFRVPDNGYFLKIDPGDGAARLAPMMPAARTWWPNSSREGEEPIFGLARRSLTAALPWRGRPALCSSPARQYDALEREGCRARHAAATAGGQFRHGHHGRAVLAPHLPRPETAKLCTGLNTHFPLKMDRRNAL